MYRCWCTDGLGLIIRSEQIEMKSFKSHSEVKSARKSIHCSGDTSQCTIFTIYLAKFFQKARKETKKMKSMSSQIQKNFIAHLTLALFQTSGRMVSNYILFCTFDKTESTILAPMLFALVLSLRANTVIIPAWSPRFSLLLWGRTNVILHCDAFPSRNSHMHRIKVRNIVIKSCIKHAHKILTNLHCIFALLPFLQQQKNDWKRINNYTFECA